MSLVYDRATHPPRVIGVCVVGVLVAFLVQTAVLPAVGLSAAIPFVYATVAVLGAALGSRTGAITGFCAGLLLDLTGVGSLGVGALVGCLLGALAGRVRTDRWWASGVLTVSALVAVAGLAFTELNAVIAQLPLAPDAGWWWILGGAVMSVALLMPTRLWLREVVR